MGLLHKHAELFSCRTHQVLTKGVAGSVNSSPEPNPNPAGSGINPSWKRKIDSLSIFAFCKIILFQREKSEVGAIITGYILNTVVYWL
jgi:hypothetical protein